MDKDQLSFFDENNFENGKKLIVSIDKVYIAVVIVVLLTVVSFSLGVERGKKISQRHDSYDIVKQAVSAGLPVSAEAGNQLVGNVTQGSDDIPVSVDDAKALADQTQVDLVSQVAEEEAVAAKNADQPKKPTEKIAEKKTDKNLTVDTKPKTKESFPYTIQVASFGKKSAAQAVAEKIEKRGLKTLIARRGSMYSLTAGEFKTKNDARKAVSSLKSSYRDCFIRNR